MHRQNLFADVPWDGEDTPTGLRRRVFWRPDHARMGATLYEFDPGYDGDRVHMHYGREEMFFVLSGRVVLRNLEGEEDARCRRLPVLSRRDEPACTPSATRTTCRPGSLP